MAKQLKILSYNLYNSKAFSELVTIVGEHQPDILCVQEFNVSQEAINQLEKVGYELADYSYSFFKYFRIFSVAMFFNPQTVKHHGGTAIDLVRSFYELILAFFRVGGHERTALTNSFTFKENQQVFRVCTSHLTALQSRNQVRMRQLRAALNHLQQEPTVPAVVIGDFNFMYNRHKLEWLFREFNFQEATSNLGYTLEWVIFKFLRLRFKPDYVWFRHLSRVSCERLAHTHSDHFPILATFAF